MKLLRLVQWLVCLGISVAYFRIVQSVYRYFVNTAIDSAANSRVGNLHDCDFSRVLDCSNTTQPAVTDWFWEVHAPTWGIAILSGVVALYLVFVFAIPEKVVPAAMRLTRQS